MIAVSLTAELTLMNILGIVIRKAGVVNKDFTTRLTAVVMNFCLPCLIFYSISNAVVFSVEALANCTVVMVIGLLAALLPLLIGHILYLAHHKTGEGRIVRYGIAFCHFSFMGFPVMAAFFGEMGTLYYAFFAIPVRIVYWTLPEILMSPPDQSGAKRNLGPALKRSLLSPQLLAVFVGLIFWVLGLKFPAPIHNCIKSLNSITSPLSLLLCGMVMGEYDFKRMLNAKYIRLPILRTVLMPAIFYGLSRLFLLVGVEDLICQMLVIYAAFPMASLTATYAVKYDPNPENQFMAAATSVISVLFSAITLPLWYALL